MIYFFLATLPHSIHPSLPLIVETGDLSEHLWKYVLLLFLLGVLFYLIYYFKKAQKEKPALGYLYSKKRIVNIQKEFQVIKEKTQNSGEFRDGVHELASLLREYIEQESPQRIKITALTVEELNTILESKNSKDLFEELLEVQFGQASPEKESFEEIVQKAEKVSSQKYFSALKKR